MLSQFHRGLESISRLVSHFIPFSFGRTANPKSSSSVASGSAEGLPQPRFLGFSGDLRSKVSRNTAMTNAREGIAASLVLGLVATLLVLFPAVSSSANTRDYAQQDGQEFFVVFPGVYTGGDHLALVFEASVSAEITITWPDDITTTRSLIANTQLKLPLDASVRSGVTVIDASYNQITREGALQITSSHPISLFAIYGVNSILEMTRVLPTSSLGPEYRLFPFVQPSTKRRFSIVATEDLTTVTISDFVSLEGPSSPVTIVLNKGEKYSVQAYTSGGSFAGGWVRASNPVALFEASYAEKAFSVAGASPDDNAMDIFYEQALPTQQWGKTYVAVSSPSTLVVDDYAIIALNDQTAVEVDGTQVAMLGSGQIFKASFSSTISAHFISASGPILVAQQNNRLGTSSGYSDGVTTRAGDGGYVYLTPTNQFLKTYRFLDPGVSPLKFALVAIPTNSSESFEIDGNPVPASSFSELAGSQYSFGHFSLAGGARELSAPVPFGLAFLGVDNYDGYFVSGGSAGLDLQAMPEGVFTVFTASPAVQTPPTTPVQPPPTSLPVVESSAPLRYEGPTVFDSRMLVYPGDTVKLSGKKLNYINEAFVDGRELQITKALSESLEIVISPESKTGLYDLVVFSNYGKLTVIALLEIREEPLEAWAETELLGYRWSPKFDGISRDLDTRHIESVQTSLGQFTSATTVVCWAYTTAASPNSWAIAHATQRAQNTCDAVSNANPKLKTFVRVRYGAPKSAAMRSSLQFWQQKPPL